HGRPGRARGPGGHPRLTRRGPVRARSTDRLRRGGAGLTGRTQPHSEHQPGRGLRFPGPCGVVCCRAGRGTPRLRTPVPSPTRGGRPMMITITFVLVTVAVLAQATVINRLPFDWNAGPDLVVATVVAVALTTSPAAAAGTGFAAGLAIDVMPPAEHPVGRYTLVLCLEDYLVAL